MVSIDIIRMSSKGQIVIPLNMRENLSEGEELVIIKDDERFILKKVQNLTENIKEDLEFAKRTEEAYKRHERGEFIEMDSEDFLKEMEKW